MRIMRIMSDIYHNGEMYTPRKNLQKAENRIKKLEAELNGIDQHQAGAMSKMNDKASPIDGLVMCDWVDIHQEMPEDFIEEFSRDNPEILYEVKDKQGYEWKADLRYWPISKDMSPITHWKRKDT